MIAGAAMAQAQTRVSLGFFHDSLSPQGDWVVSAQYGNVWRPHVAFGWRPYVYGHWVYSDFGWTWLSDEDWGWATYHYGRWYLDPAFGWCWVPGDEWAPAWVDWQWGDGWIGWAPLPPAFVWTGFDLRFGGVIAPQAFVFVQDRFFLDPRVGFRAIDPVRNAVLLRSTRNVTRYAMVNNTVAVRSLPVDQIQRVTGRAVPRYQVFSSSTRVNPRVQGNRLVVYRPQVSHTRPARPPALSRMSTARPAAVTRPRSQPSVATSHPVAHRAFAPSRPARRHEVARPSVATRAQGLQHVTLRHQAPAAEIRAHGARRPQAAHPVNPKAAKRVPDKRIHPNGGKPPGS